MESSTKLSSKNDPKPWTCACTGYNTEWNKDNLTLVGRWVTHTWVITSSSITHRHITIASTNTICTAPPTQLLDKTIRDLYCEGVLICAPALSPGPQLHVRTSTHSASTTPQSSHSVFFPRIYSPNPTIILPPLNVVAHGSYHSSFFTQLDQYQ
jgi:hypothetical protein